MIYLGYDPVCQAEIAMHNGTVIVCDGSQRASEILNGLCTVALPHPELHSAGVEDGVEIVVRTPWMKTVQYSDQAWNDLLSVALEVIE